MNLLKRAGLILGVTCMSMTMFQVAAFAEDINETKLVDAINGVSITNDIEFPEVTGDALEARGLTTVDIQDSEETKEDLSELEDNKKLKVTLSYKKIYVTGKKCKPKVSVTREGKALKKDTDYTVSYKNNKKVGKAKVVIEGIGDYSGTINKKFTIKKLSKVKLSKSCREFDKFILGKTKNLAKKSVEVKYKGKIFSGVTGEDGDFQVELPLIKKSGEKIALRVKNKLAYSEWTTTEVEDYQVPEGIRKGKNGYCSPLKDGYRVSRGIGSGHYGIDLCAPKGTSIYAAKYGEVVYSGYGAGAYNGYGYIVVVRDDDGYYQLYAHMMKQPDVKCGQKVFPGQKIGHVGSTGNSSGNHLHFEIHFYYY